MSATAAEISSRASTLEIEQALIGALLRRPAIMRDAAAILRPSHFVDDVHRRIFESMVAIDRAGKRVGVISVGHVLTDVEAPKNCPGGVPGYLKRLSESAPITGEARDLAGYVLDAWRRRELVIVARQIEDAANSTSIETPADIIAGQALTALRDLSAGEASEWKFTFGEATKRTLERISERMEGAQRSGLVTTGFHDIDRATGGYEPGTLWIVAARPGVGKSVFMVASSRRVAVAGAKAESDNFGAIALSLEIPERQIFSRYIADHIYSGMRRIDFGRISREDVTESEFEEIYHARKSINQLPLSIAVPPKRLTLDEIASLVREEKASLAARGVRLSAVFIDYLKFIKAGDRYKGSRVYEIGEISAGLKELSRSENVCIILLAQLNRALEGREDKRPHLADLRESGDLEADADVVAFLHREAYHIAKSPEFIRGNPDAQMLYDEKENEVEFIIGKNRAGPTSVFKLWCDVSCSTMSSAAR